MQAACQGKNRGKSSGQKRGVKNGEEYWGAESSAQLIIEEFSEFVTLLEMSGKLLLQLFVFDMLDGGFAMAE